MVIQINLGKQVLIVGTTGSGKTNACIYVYENSPKDIPVIWYDLEEDYDLLSTVSDITVEEMEDLLQAIEDGYNRIHFLEPKPFRDLQFRRWNDLCRLAFHLGDCMLFCDEVMRVCELFTISDWHFACLTRGRKRQITLVQATQRTQAINKTLVTESHVRFTYELSDYDIRAVGAWFPEAKWLGNLPDYHFVYKEGKRADIHDPLPLVLPRDTIVFDEEEEDKRPSSGRLTGRRVG